MVNTRGQTGGEAIFASMCSKRGPAVFQPRWGSRQNDPQAHPDIHKINSRGSIPGGGARFCVIRMAQQCTAQITTAKKIWNSSRPRQVHLEERLGLPEVVLSNIDPPSETPVSCHTPYNIVHDNIV